MKRQLNKISLIVAVFLLMQAISLSVVPSTVGASGGLEVQMYNLITTPISNEIQPYFKLLNNSATAISLKDVKIRYYYTADDYINQRFCCYYSTAGSANVNGNFERMESPSQNANSYLEIGFESAAGMISPNSAVEVKVSFWKDGWLSNNQADDYSFNSVANNFTDWNKATVYLSGVLQFGVEPITSTPTPSATLPPLPTPIAKNVYEGNFEDGSTKGWKVETGTWSVVTDGSKVYNSQAGSVNSVSVLNKSTFGFGTAEMKIKVNSWGSMAQKFVGILGRYTDSNNYYMFGFDSGNLYIKKKVNGTLTTLKSVAYTINAGTTYTIKAQTSGSILALYINGTLRVSSMDSTFDSGKFGLISTGSSVNYDDIKLNDLSSKRFMIIESGSLYNDGLIQSSIDTYQADLAKEGWTSTVVTVGGSEVQNVDEVCNDCSDLKKVIRRYYNNNYSGMVFVGSYPDIPLVPWRPRSSDDRKLISDYYYADLFGYVDSNEDGVMEFVEDWLDLDNDGIFEAYKGEGKNTPLVTEAEMMYGRIDAGGMSNDLAIQAEKINSYFKKLHDYRVDGSTMAEEKQKEAFFFVDDPWSDMKYGDYGKHNVLKEAFSKLHFVIDDAATSEKKLEEELQKEYYYAEIFTHGAPNYLQIHDLKSSRTVLNDEFTLEKLDELKAAISNNDIPKAHIIHSHGCETSKYADWNYEANGGGTNIPENIPNFGEAYLFNSKYTLNITSVCEISQWSNMDKEYFSDLSSMCIGEAYKGGASRWYRNGYYNNASDVAIWVLLGDPTLKHNLSVGTNKCPFITTSLNEHPAIAGTPYSLTFDVEDPDLADSVTVSVENLPSGASFNPTTRTISWLPDSSLVGETYYPTVKATDNQGNIYSEDFTIQVMKPMANPGFEETNIQGKPSVWSFLSSNTLQAGAYSSDSATKRSGSKSAKIALSSDNSVQLLQNNIGVKRFQKYKLSCFVKTSNVTVRSTDGKNTVASLSVDVMKEGVTYPCVSDTTLTGTNDWKEVILYFDSGDTRTVSLKIGVGNDTNKCTGTVWIDDVKLEEM